MPGTNIEGWGGGGDGSWGWYAEMEALGEYTGDFEGYENHWSWIAYPEDFDVST